jgi:hypothetical protein
LKYSETYGGIAVASFMLVVSWLSIFGRSPLIRHAYGEITPPVQVNFVLLKHGMAMAPATSEPTKMFGTER